MIWKEIDMENYLVKNLALINSLEQARDLYRNQEKNINLDFYDLNFVRSAGMIIFASCVQDLKK